MEYAPKGTGQNYMPNLRHWQKGDLVVHDADAKKPHMLMIVIGYTKDGLCRTRYVNHDIAGRKVWINEIRYLHDPALWGMPTELNVAIGK